MVVLFCVCVFVYVLPVQYITLQNVGQRQTASVFVLRNGLVINIFVVLLYGY
jgi:hypothetical protein